MTKALSFLKNKKILVQIGFLGLIAFIFLTNTVHESYPDEFDNILGGWYTLHGRLIYTGFFTHHGPFAYYLSALIEIFSGQSFVRFRLLYALFLFVLTFGSYYYLKKSVRSISMSFYIGFILLLAVASTYFWGHMLLADSLSGFLLTPVVGLIFLKSFYQENISHKDIWFISLLTSSSLLSSMTYAYLAIGVYAFLLFNYFKDRFEKKYLFSKDTLKILSILGFPYVLFFLYLIVTNSLADFFYQTIIFNTRYYIYNYPRPEGSTTVNPIRYAIVIAQDFHNNFSSLLISAKDFNFPFPFSITLAVADTCLAIYLFMKRRYLLLLFVLYVLVYANARSNPWTSRETDYQSAVYIMLSFFNLCFTLPLLYQELNKNIEYTKKLILSFLFLLLGIYTFYNCTFLLRKYTEKTYSKFMGFQALIYDRPRIAPILMAATNPGDYAWAGPFEFEELFYLNRPIPSKYHILIPGIGKSEKTSQEMIADFTKNKPKAIMFDKTYNIYSSTPEMHAKAFLQFLRDNYTTLYEYRDGKKKYMSVAPIDLRVDIETKLYIRKDSVEEVVQKLLAANYIREVPAK